MVDLVDDLLDNVALAKTIGFEPYVTPVNLLDPKTGDLLTDPVCPDNAPGIIFVNNDSCEWFEDGPWPRGPFSSSGLSLAQTREAVSKWVCAFTAT